MPAWQVIRGGSKVDEQFCSISCDQFCATSLAFVLEECGPPPGKCVTIRKETTNALADQFVSGKSQDARCRWICIQAIALVIHDQDSVEYILEDGREFTICVTKSLVSVTMLSSDIPE
jgi:hypothetical protein